MIELREKKTAAEKSYRLLSAHSSVSAEERLKHNFELNVQKARLELCLTQLTYYEHSFNISRSQTAEVEAKLDLLDPLIKRVRANISKESGGFDYLNSFVFRHERALRDTLERLNERFKEMDDARRDDMELTPLERYCNATGRRLASDEAVYVLDMIKLWSATRLAWRSIRPSAWAHELPGEPRDAGADEEPHNLRRDAHQRREQQPPNDTRRGAGGAAPLRDHHA